MLPNSSNKVGRSSVVVAQSGAVNAKKELVTKFVFFSWKLFPPKIFDKDLTFEILSVPPHVFPTLAFHCPIHQFPEYFEDKLF